MQLEKIGNSFGGEVFTYPIAKLEQLFDSELNFAVTGSDSLMKTLKIPSKFFSKQNLTVKKDLLIRQKADFESEDRLSFLIKDNQIVFVSKFNDNLGIEDPKTKFSINRESNWLFRDEDYSKGYQTYVYYDFSTSKEEFVPALYLEVPILYHSKMNFRMGLYRLICTNGMLDNIISQNFALKTNLLQPEIVNPVMQGLLEGFIESKDVYLPFIDYLKHDNINSLTSTEVLIKWKRSKKIPKDLYKNLTSWINYVSQGKQDTDPLLPTEIATSMDLVNATTRYSQNLNFSNRKKVDSFIFDYYYTQFKNDTQKSIKGLHIKDLIENLGVIPNNN